MDFDKRLAVDLVLYDTPHKGITFKKVGRNKAAYPYC